MTPYEEIARSLNTITDEYTKCTVRNWYNKPEKYMEMIQDTVKRMHSATEFVSRRLGDDSKVLATAFMDTFISIYNKIRDKVETYETEPTIIIEIAEDVYRMYKLFHLRLDYLDEFPGNERLDPLLGYVLAKTPDKETAIKMIKSRINHLIADDFANLKKDQMIAKNTIGNFTESVLDNVTHPISSGYSDNQISIYGDSSSHQTYLNGIPANILKEELFHLVNGGIMRYMDPTVKSVDFNIPSQMKMYLQAEFNTSAIVANLRIGDVVHFLTVLNYDGDNFLLFTKDNDPATVYGITLNEEPGTKERKLLSIGKDDSLSFDIVISEV